MAVVLAIPASGRDIFDFFKLKPTPAATSSVAAARSLSELTQDQVVNGLKEALSKGSRQAIAGLGRPNGFLTNLNVRIPMPNNLRGAERLLRRLRQDQLADEFITTMNRAAEKAVPEAAAVLSDSIKQMTLADAKGILTGTNNAATLYFRRTGETNLFTVSSPLSNRRRSRWD